MACDDPMDVMGWGGRYVGWGCNMPTWQLCQQVDGLWAGVGLLTSWIGW